MYSLNWFLKKDPPPNIFWIRHPIVIIPHLSSQTKKNPSIMASQPTPPLTYPPPQKQWFNKALLRETNG